MNRITSWTWDALADEYLTILQWVADGSPEGEMPMFSSAQTGLSLVANSRV